MKKYTEIIQQSEEWFKIKHGKVGGSSSKGLFIKTDTLMLEILAAKCEDFELDEDSYESSSMLRGNELEPVAVRELESYTGVEFESIGWIEHETIKLLGISPDGLNKSETVACEVKCLTSKKHVEVIKDNIIPIDHVHQCIHYFTNIETLKELHFASFRPENKFKPLFVKTINRDSIVNIGTKAKPVNKTIEECVLMSTSNARLLEIEVEKQVELIKF